MPSTNPIVKELGHKPYIDPGKGRDGGYVNAMRRTTQAAENNTDRSGLMVNNQRRGAISMNDAREVTSVLDKVSVGSLPLACWGIAFDSGGGCYATQYNGDILYRAPGQWVFAPLGQTTRAWYKIAVSPLNGDVYASVDGYFKPYVRAGGVGDFVEISDAPVIFEGVFGCAPNGDVYLSNWSGPPYMRAGGVGLFVLQTDVTDRRFVRFFACAPNGDVYSSSSAAGDLKVYLRPGGVGDFVLVSELPSGAFSGAAAPNGDIYVTPYGSSAITYIRRGGVGVFSPLITLGVAAMDFAVSPAGDPYAQTGLDTNYIQYLITTLNTVQPPKNTIVQSHATPGTVTQPLRKNLKPYANRTYEEMQQFAQPIEVTGKERVPETDGLPVLIDHIPEVSWYVRSGAPVVIDIPTTVQDPISRIEVLGGDGMASVAPNGTSAIYKPGASSNTLLIVHTKSGQQCTVNLMAK